MYLSYTHQPGALLRAWTPEMMDQRLAALRFQAKRALARGDWDGARVICGIIVGLRWCRGQR